MTVAPNRSGRPHLSQIVRLFAFRKSSPRARRPRGRDWRDRDVDQHRFRRAHIDVWRRPRGIPGPSRRL